MQAERQQWNLFGYDLSRSGRFIRAGWQELFRGRQAGVRRRLESPVILRCADGSQQYYVAETPVSPDDVQEQTAFHALELPPEFVLSKELTLPAALELELDSAMALEAQSSSPFPGENTCYGWTLLERRDDRLRVLLAIAARDDIDGFLREQGADAESGRPLPEVWVLDGHGHPVVMQGFGESQRYRAYTRRVATFAVKVAVIAVLAVVLAAVPAVVRGLQAEKMQGYLQEVQSEAATAQSLREELVTGNERIEAMQQVIDERVDYHDVLTHLTSQTPENVYLQRFEAQGREMRVDGWAENAASYLQVLTNDAVYDEVSAPSAFSRNNRTGLERFVLDIELATGDRE